MLTLILLRHAKSSWADPTLIDFERPLGERGRRAAPCTGRFLAQAGYAPEVVLCSPALRTRQTLDLVLDQFADAPKAIFDQNIYGALTSTLLELVRAAPRCKSLMLIGHNPAIHGLALELIGFGSRGEISDLVRKYPTAAAAVLKFEASGWSDLRAGLGTLACFVNPKALLAEAA